MWADEPLEPRSSIGEGGKLGHEFEPPSSSGHLKVCIRLVAMSNPALAFREPRSRVPAGTGSAYAVIELRSRINLGEGNGCLIFVCVWPSWSGRCWRWLDPTSGLAASDGVVISQVYGGGGNAGASFTHDFIELFNRGTTPVVLDGMSVQYASATGTGALGANAGQLTRALRHDPARQVPPHPRGLDAAVGAALPATDVVDATPIAMAAGRRQGRAGHRNDHAQLQHRRRLHYGRHARPYCRPRRLRKRNVLRGDGRSSHHQCNHVGRQGRQRLHRDRRQRGRLRRRSRRLLLATPRRRHSSAAERPRRLAPSAVGSATPGSVLAGGSTLLTVAVTPGANPTSTDISVIGDLSEIGGSDTQAFFDDGTNGDAVAGNNVFSYGATVAAGTTPGAKSLPVVVTDAQERMAGAAIALTVAEPPAAPIEISEIQGAAHLSPHNGETVDRPPES